MLDSVTEIPETKLRTLHCAFQEVPDGLSAGAILGGCGDTKIIWDATKPDEVDAARTLFQTLIAKHYKAFLAKDNEGESGAPGEPVKEFDPKHQRLVFVPRLVGG